SLGLRGTESPMYCKSIAVVAAVAVLVSLAAVASPDDERKPKLHPSSDPHAIITAAFWESGYAAQDAADLATRAIMKIKGLEVDTVDISPSRKTDLIPLHPDSDPHAILVMEYLESGWSAEEAVQHTNQHFLSLLGIEPGEWDLQPLGLDCIVYAARIITYD